MGKIVLLLQFNKARTWIGWVDEERKVQIDFFFLKKKIEGGFQKEEGLRIHGIKSTTTSTQNILLCLVLLTR